MNIETELIISLLKLTKNGPFLKKSIKNDIILTSLFAQNMLRKLEKEGLIYLRKNMVEANDLQRLKLAIHAMKLGADFERVSRFLQWREFENIAVVAFERNSYGVEKNLRFRHAGRKWQIDIVGFKKPIVLCVDCKHWRRGVRPSALRKITELQVERTIALAEALPNLSGKIECTSWKKVKLVPAVLLLFAGRFKFYDNVPIVSVLQLQDFLRQLPAYVDSLKHFLKSLAN